MPRKEPEVVTPEWLRTVQAALMDQVCHVALRYAYGRVEMMKRADVVVQEDEAFALANDAIADTMTRVRVWDPARVKLSTHLCGVIRSRTNARIARVRRIRHESIHEVDEDQGGEAEVEASLAVADERQRTVAVMSMAELVGKVVGQLRCEAAGDDDVLAMLATYELGATSQGEVMERLGWELPRFVNVKRRLTRLVRRLPPELQGGTRGAGHEA
jgi:hypothetical protein